MVFNTSKKLSECRIGELKTEIGVNRLDKKFILYVEERNFNTLP